MFFLQPRRHPSKLQLQLISQGWILWLEDNPHHSSHWAREKHCALHADHGFEAKFFPLLQTFEISSAHNPRDAIFGHATTLTEFHTHIITYCQPLLRELEHFGDPRYKAKRHNAHSSSH